MTTALVGLDVGTTGVKAIAVSERGDVLARAEHGYSLATPQPGWTEQDPEDWWRAAEAALGELAVEPAGVGFSGQMHGLVVLDEHDDVVRPAISGTTSARAPRFASSSSSSEPNTCSS